jgi:rhodanese-related sulfurtransferase
VEQQYSDIFTVVLAVLAVVAWKFAPRLIAGVPFLDPGEVRRRLDAGELEVVIDVRSPGEYAGMPGHIPGAVNLPAGDIIPRLKALAQELEPSKQLPVVVTCGGEQRATHAIRSLKKAGFTNLAVLKGGMRAWKRIGLPMQSGTEPVADLEPEETVAAVPAVQPAAQVEQEMPVPVSEATPAEAPAAESEPPPEPAKTDRA